jgi:uncharacterized membrane protein YfcA
VAGGRRRCRDAEGRRHRPHLTGDSLLLLVAGFGAGFVNGIAGGGSLISFPALLALGHPAIVANVTSTVGIWSGYLGGVAGYRREVRAQAGRVRALAPIALGGGLTGALLLLVTPDGVFDALAPVLVLLACGLFAAQPVLARRLRAQRAERPASAVLRRGGLVLPAVVGTFLAAVYGGYFGAGMGVVLLAVLGLALDDELARINGIRGVISLLVNSIAVVVFAVGADVAWGDAGLLSVSALVGGYSGARLARRMPVPVFRAVVIVLGLVAVGKLVFG